MEKSNHNPAAAVCMRQAKSCGFLIMKSDLSFLLMKHPKRYDLPKGHVDSGESEQQTALRGIFFLCNIYLLYYSKESSGLCKFHSASHHLNFQSCVKNPEF